MFIINKTYIASIALRDGVIVLCNHTCNQGQRISVIILDYIGQCSQVIVIVLNYNTKVIVNLITFHE